MARFYLPPAAWATGILEGDEARHLSQVLRIKIGESITVFDGKGSRAAAKVLTISRDRVLLELADTLTYPLPSPSITLAQAIPKGKNMDLIVQKSVELGVTAIQPLVTRHTVVQPGEGKSDKWRRNALEACKQCGQDALPEITDPISFDPWLAAQTHNDSLKIIASLAPGARSFRQILREIPIPSSVTYLVGPEGDFSPEETTAALDAGFIPVSLGTIILRVETATLFGISALRYEFDQA